MTNNCMSLVRVHYPALSCQNQITMTEPKVIKTRHLASVPFSTSFTMSLILSKMLCINVLTNVITSATGAQMTGIHLFQYAKRAASVHGASTCPDLLALPHDCS